MAQNDQANTKHAVERALADLGRRDLTRRQLLGRVGIGVVGVGLAPTLLAACGGGSDSPSPAPEASPPPAAPPAASGSLGGTLDFIGYEGDDLQAPLEAWRGENGVELKSTFIASPLDITGKYAAGGGEGIDLIDVANNYLPLLQKPTDILLPLDESKLPSLGNLLPRFEVEDDPGWTNAAGQRVLVPFYFAGASITYDESAMDEPKAWADLLDPSLKGKVAMLDDPAWNLLLGCVALGLDSAKIPKDSLGDLSDYLKQFVAQTKTLSAGFGDMATALISGEATVCFGGYPVINAIAAAAEKPAIKSNVAPTEGTFGFAEGFSIGVSSDNVETAYAYIEQTLQPDINAAANISISCGVTVEGAEPLLDDLTRSLYPYDDLDAYFDQAPFLLLPTDDPAYVTLEEWVAAWTEIRAG